MGDLFVKSGAQFSEDRQYRYCLWRIWDVEKPFVMFVGLNPSTANEIKSDPTITRIKGIAEKNGYGGFYMMNLFGIVSADPKVLKSHANPIGENNGWLEEISVKCQDIVFCWGAFKEAKERAKEVIAMFPNAYCLGKNKDGSPKHPLYLLGNTIPIKFNS